MIYLQTISFYKSNLKECFSAREQKPPSAKTKIYNDSLQGLAELGLVPDNGNFVFDDGSSYPVTKYAEGIIKKIHNINPPKTENKIQDSTNIKPHTEDETSKSNFDSIPELKMDETESYKQKDTNQILNSSQLQPVLMSVKRDIILTNKKNPNDVKEIVFTIIPLTIIDNAVATDIAVVCSCKEGVSYFVSDFMKKSITLTAEGIEFAIRGQFENRKFKESIFPLGKANAEYSISVSSKRDSLPDVLPDVYANLYKRKIDDTELTVLPLAKINAPSGRCECVVIQDDGKTRLIHPMKNELLYLLISNVKYRIYTAWKNGGFNIVIDQTE